MSERFYRWLLRLYPARFRREYGEAMAQLFRDRMREGGSGGRKLCVWTAMLRDLAVSLAREHFHPPRTAAVNAGVYRLSPEAVREMVWRSHIAAQPSVGAALLCGFALGLLGGAPSAVLAGVFGALTMLLVVVSFHGGRSMRQYWTSYEVLLEDDRIALRRQGRIVQEISRQQLAALTESPGHGLAVQTADPRRAIWIPARMTGYEELRARLAEWAEIESPPVRRPASVTAHLHPILPGWALCFFLATLLSTRPQVVIPSAAMLAGCVIWVIVTLSFRFGRRAWLGISISLLPLLALIAKVAAVVLRG